MNCLRTRSLVFAALCFACGWLMSTEQAAAQSDAFSRGTIDIGVVVSDLEDSIAFYSEAIGLQAAGEIICPHEVAGPSGLTDGTPFVVKVYVLSEGADATKLKLIEMPEIESAPLQNEFIHTQLGYSYITIFVNSTEDALARLEAAGVEPLAEGPVALSDDEDPVYLTLVRDPDGNIVELVGPMTASP